MTSYQITMIIMVSIIAVSLIISGIVEVRRRKRGE